MNSHLLISVSSSSFSSFSPRRRRRDHRSAGSRVKETRKEGRADDRRRRRRASGRALAYVSTRTREREVIRRDRSCYCVRVDRACTSTLLHSRAFPPEILRDALEHHRASLPRVARSSSPRTGDLIGQAVKRTLSSPGDTSLVFSYGTRTRRVPNTRRSRRGHAE